VREGLTNVPASQVVQKLRGAFPVVSISIRTSDSSSDARLSAAGGELEQIQMLLGHASVQTTERYLGTKQDLMHAPNDGIKLRVAV
jgi:integrase